MEISNLNKSVVFTRETDKFIFPVNSIYYINIGDIVTVRLKGNRRNLFSFNYQEVTNLEASDVNDFITKLNEISFK